MDSPRLRHPENSVNQSRLQERLAGAHPSVLAVFCSIAGFCTYFCMYAFRKPFTVGTYDVPQLWGIDYKIVLILTQVAGYTLSKFIGVKVIAEMPPHRRVLAILVLIGVAELALILVGVTPYPYNFVWFFLNGLPLGMIWGLVFSFLEGRRTTDALSATLATSFIVSSFVVKAVGQFTMDRWGVSEFWMPAVTGGLFVPPLLFFVWMLSRIPAPAVEDVEHRTERIPMTRADRRGMFQTFAGGLVLFIIVHMALTAYRDFRDNFAKEIFTELQLTEVVSKLSTSELLPAVCVVIALGSIMAIRNNRLAFGVIHGVQFAGLLLTGLCTLAFRAGMLDPFPWFILIGIGMYLAYVPFHTLLFERLIATFRYRANAGYLIYIVDATGYLASVGILLYKNFFAAELSWLEFFVTSTYIVSVLGSIAFGFSFLYFARKLQTLPTDVPVAQGPKGGVLREGTLTPISVDEAEATRILETQIESKLADGYLQPGESIDTGTAADLEFDDDDGLDFDVDVHDDEEAADLVFDPDDAAGNLRAAAVLRRLDEGPRKRAKWKLSRAVWRAGEMRLQAAEASLLGLLGTGDVMLDYCIVWALGQCGTANSIAPLREVVSDQRNYATVRRIARFALFELLEGTARQRAIDECLDGLPAPLKHPARSGSVAEILDGLSSCLDAKSPESYAVLETLYLIDTPNVRAALLELLLTAPLRPNFFQRIRHLFKAAEMRRDAEMFGLIAYRFETTLAMFTMPGWYSYSRQKKPTIGPNAEKAFSSQTRDYLRKRVWRTIDRLGELQADDYVRMAAGILLPFRDADAMATRQLRRIDWAAYHQFRRYEFLETHIDRFGIYWAFNKILYGNSPRYTSNRRKNHFECKPPYEPGGAEPRVREELYPRLWERHPAVVLQLLEKSRCAPVHHFAVKVLNDCTSFCRELPVDALTMLLQSDYEVTAEFGFRWAVDRYDPTRPNRALVLAMVNCRFAPAREQARKWIDKQPDAFRHDSEFLVGLMSTPHDDTREFVRTFLQEHVLDDSVASAVIGRLFAVLQSLAAGDELQAANLTGLMIDVFAQPLRTIGPEVIRDLLAHPLFEIQKFAGDLVLGHETLSKRPPADVVGALLHSGHPDVRGIGVRIVGQLPDDVLKNSMDLLLELTRSELSDVREAIRSTVARLAGTDQVFGRRIAAQLVDALLVPGAPEGVPSHTARVLRDDLGACLDEIPAETVWKLLNSRSSPAQEIGGVLLATNVRTEDLSAEEIVRLASHPIVAVRESAWTMCNDDVDRMRADPDATSRLLESKWDDTRQIAFQFFREHFSEEGSIPPEVLIAICDSVRPDVQQFGRQLVTRLFDDAHGEEYVIKLSEHPAESMQIFASNFLEQHAADNPKRLRQLAPYFLSVLSRVNKGRVSKQRALMFLEREALKSEDAARIVAGMIGRISATAAVIVKAATIELMLKIHAAWPEIELPIEVLPAEEEIDWAEVAATRRDVAARLREVREELDELRKRSAERLRPFHAARQRYFDYIYKRDYDAWIVLDPVITVHPDEVFFECFSRDESSYGRLSAGFEVFENVGEFACGTTNIDYSSSLYDEFQKIRTYKTTQFEIDPSGFEVQTTNEASYKEVKIDLPDSWVRGFLQVSSAMSLPMTSIRLHPMDVHNICFILRRRKELIGPRSMRYQISPGRPLKIVFDPWGIELECARSICEGDREEEIRVWGRRRIHILERLIPVANSFTVHLLGKGMPSFYSADLGNMTFTLGLSGWTSNDWSASGNFDLLAPRAEVDSDTQQRVFDALKDKWLETPDGLANELGLDRATVLGALAAWTQAGRAIWDLQKGVYRLRELSREPLPLEQIRFVNEREETATRHVDEKRALRQAARKRRMEESRRKRKENKERRIRERQQRAEAWRIRQASEICYLGDGVSGGLNHHDGDRRKLAARNLPTVGDPGELAEAMGISVSELRFLAYGRRTSTTTHYVRFAIPKKTGGVRNISAPMPRLKRAQEWVLAGILENVELNRAAHGFRRGRSIVTNATPHVRADVVVNVDIEDFFPTITFRRIKGVFRNLGYSESVATILAMLCSEPDTAAVRIDNRNYHVATSERYLPQGAPSSPALTNIICRGLDARMAHNAGKLGFTYTRYADDMTFSSSGEANRQTGRLLRRVKHIVEAEGFRLHPDKSRVQRKGRRQEVTGLIVNERVNVSRKTLRRFRAVLFQIERDGPAGKHWGNSPDVLSSIEGFANFVAMVDPEKGADFQSRVRALIERYGRPQSSHAVRSRWKPKQTRADSTTPAAATSVESPPREVAEQPATEPPVRKKKPWWKFW
eukprot:g12607.t1